MNSTRFQILCKDGAWRYVFCRSGNSTNPQTGSSIIPTDDRDKAYVAHSQAQADKDLAYFVAHGNGRIVELERVVPSFSDLSQGWRGMVRKTGDDAGIWMVHPVEPCNYNNGSRKWNGSHENDHARRIDRNTGEPRAC